MLGDVLYGCRPFLLPAAAGLFSCAHGRLLVEAACRASWSLCSCEPRLPLSGCFYLKLLCVVGVDGVMMACLGVVFFTFLEFEVWGLLACVGLQFSSDLETFQPHSLP